MVKIEDSQLVQKAKGGDGAAYEELIKRYCRLVWVIIYDIVKDPTWTEDLVQDTFLKAWQALETLRNPDSFRSWLIIIARRNAIQHMENIYREGELIKKLASTDELSTHFLEDEVVKDKNLHEQLQWAISQLPERYRWPLYLRYQEGYDYKKISQILNISNGSLRGLLHRGIKLLRQYLKEPDI